MDLFKAIDDGVASNFHVIDKGIRQDAPELIDVLHGSAAAGAYLWIFFLALLVWRWRSATGKFPFANLAKVLLIIALVEGLRLLLDRPRPDNAFEFYGARVGGSFPNGPTFRAVLISALMWETTQPGWTRWLSLLGAGLYCGWVVMGQLLVHLGNLTDILASLALALGVGFLSPRIFGDSTKT